MIFKLGTSNVHQIRHVFWGSRTVSKKSTLSKSTLDRGRRSTVYLLWNSQRRNSEQVLLVGFCTVFLTSFVHDWRLFSFQICNRCWLYLHVFDFLEGKLFKAHAGKRPLWNDCVRNFMQSEHWAKTVNSLFTTKEHLKRSHLEVTQWFHHMTLSQLHSHH